jgi:hypothetical protein
MSADQFEVENDEPLHFIVTENYHKHRYEFHVAEKDGRKILNRDGHYILTDEPKATKNAKFYANAAFQFAQAEARSRRLID